jgi:hypothetical protein
MRILRITYKEKDCMAITQKGIYGILKKATSNL